MRQLVDHWEQHGVVSPGGALTFPPEELTASVPASLRAYIDEQLAAQAPEDVELLVAASVAGRSFSPALIADAVGRRDSEVRAALTRMAGTGGGMIEPLGDGFRFAHDLYREVLYESAPEDERAALHRRIATFMEHSLGPSVRDLAGELAHHFVAGGDAAGAARFLRMAGERAFARNAYPEGVRHVRAALAAAAKLPDGTSRTRAQVELLSLLGQALVAIGGWGSPEAEEALQRARTLAQRLRDNEPLVSVLLALATLYEVRGELGRAKEVADQYLTHGADEPAARRLQAEELLACNLFHQGAFARALEHAEQGLELFGGDDGGGTEGHYSTFPATIGDNAGVACHDWAGLALWYLGHPDQALTRAREALELAGDPGRSYSLASARAQLAVIHQCRQEPRQALEWAEATIDAAEERGYAYRVAMGRVLRGWAVAALGDAEAGVEELVRGIRASRATGARMDEPHYLGLLGDAYLRADEVEAAAAHDRRGARDLVPRAVALLRPRAAAPALGRDHARPSRGRGRRGRGVAARGRRGGARPGIAVARAALGHRAGPAGPPAGPRGRGTRGARHRVRVVRRGLRLARPARRRRAARARRDAGLDGGFSATVVARLRLGVRAADVADGHAGRRRRAAPTRRGGGGVCGRRFDRGQRRARRVA